MEAINSGDKGLIKENIEKFEKGGLVQQYYNSTKEVYEKGGLVTNNITEHFHYLQTPFKTFKSEKFQQGGLVGGSQPINISNILPSIDAPISEPTQITVNVSGNVLTQDFVESDLAEAIKEAARRGIDFGIN